MDYNLIQQYKGSSIQANIKQKTIIGVLTQVDQNHSFIETDYGIVQVKNIDIADINKIKLIQDLYVYICKNPICNCGGIRMLISEKSKINWPCKYFKKFQCPIKKICNFNTLPLKIKNRFLDNMHSPIPPFETKQS